MSRLHIESGWFTPVRSARASICPPPSESEIRIELVGSPRCLNSRSRLYFRGNTLLITRILIVVMALWLPMQSMAAVGMDFCQQMPQDDTSVGTPAADIHYCSPTDPEALQTCKLCHSCIVCPTPALGDPRPILSLSPSSSFEPAALWQPYIRSLDVLERPPRPVPLS
jgi:hypothetical protein